MTIETERRQQENIPIQEFEIEDNEVLDRCSSEGFFGRVWHDKCPEGENVSSTKLLDNLQLNGSLAKHIRAPLWMGFDVLAGFIAVLAGFGLSPAFQWASTNPNASVPYVLLTSLFFGVSLVASGFVLGLYEKVTFITKVRILVLTGATTVLAGALTALFFALVLFQPVGRWVLLISMGTSFSALTLLRIRVYKSSLKDKLKVAIVGDIDEAFDIYGTLKNFSERMIYDVVCICIIDDDKSRESNTRNKFEDAELLLKGPDHSLSQAPAVCTKSELVQMASDCNVDKIIIANKQRHDLDHFSTIMAGTANGARIMSWSSFNEEILRRVVVEDLSPNWFYSANLNINNPILLSMKRAIDIFISSLGLLISLPVMAIVACLVKMTSKGPVFYKQVRTGRFGQPFLMYKFRTMKLDSDKTGPTWASQNDDRFTPIGGLLRKSRIDEIPQLWNIFKGDMSFVGTRPIRPEVVNGLVKQIPYFDMRHLVAPGLTGFAQVSFKYGASVEDQRIKLQYDLYYIKNFSILLDLQIILRTFSAMMKGAQ